MRIIQGRRTRSFVAMGAFALLAVVAGAQVNVASTGASPAVAAAAAGSVPNAAISTPPPPPPGNSTLYVVGIGDVLNISVWKEKDLSEAVVIRPDGKISMPLIGEIYIAGQTPMQAEALLQEKLKSVVIEPKVTVTVMEIHSRVVYITGEIGRPGAYPLNGPLNVLQLIAQAGGLTQFAERSKIRILKANEAQKGVPFNYNRVVHGGDARRNLLLAPGDTVVVP